MEPRVQTDAEKVEEEEEEEQPRGCSRTHKVPECHASTHGYVRTTCGVRHGGDKPCAVTMAPNLVPLGLVTLCPVPIAAVVARPRPPEVCASSPHLGNSPCHPSWQRFVLGLRGLQVTPEGSEVPPPSVPKSRAVPLLPLIHEHVRREFERAGSARARRPQHRPVLEPTLFVKSNER